MAERVREVRAGRGGMRGPRPRVENPGLILRRILDYVMQYYKINAIVAVVCIVISVLANVQGTLFMQTLIDSYIMPMLTANSTDYSGLLFAILRTAAFYCCGILAALVQARVMAYLTQGTMKHLRDDLFTHMQTLPIKFFDTHAHGDIMSIYTNDVDTLRQMVSQSVPQMLNSVITVVSVFISMVSLSIPLTVVTVVMVCLILVCSRILVGNSGRYFVAQQRELGKVNGYIEEMMNGQKVVKVFCHEDKAIEEFNELNENLYHSANRANTFSLVAMPVNGQLANLSYVVCAIVGGMLALSGATGLTLGKLASFLTFNRSFNQPINQISMQFNSIVMALAGAQRIFALLDEKPEVDTGDITLVNAKREEGDELLETTGRTGTWAWKVPQEDGKYRLVELKGDIEFKDVDFGYDPKKIVLHDITLYGRPGQKIAFVGSTGAGKTTITNLINRFYDIQKGTIEYDGIDIARIKKDDLRSSLGIVLQDTHLFTGTVMDNIRYGRLSATDEECRAAARLANADSFIRRLPNGYETMLTGDGTNLSQGQRQLLAIARAAVADPPVLILDEATSSIDTRTEQLVQQGMDGLMYGRTSFVIAHRLSTVRNSDCIMVLELGHIIERGSHDELIAQKGRYYTLYTGNFAEDS
ncbi:MAG TPA: ABC transporter ATP-binding protein/permease [Candidatus Gemmiger avicola]|uniref:ABC transporter ATP-binding protein/permease n=1 Tax=Candidatus Gemmiger avicola TaxID=2838605 RepID=A0A9D2S4D5_9FIRM|nr:ABC transporter ATP-binding protein/permease [Candidatus Gemmiger avicola]